MHKDSHMGVRGQGREKGGGAAGISWALHFVAVGGSLGRKLQSEQRAEAAKLSRQTVRMG